MTRKELILANISDLVSDLMYYDRKEDEELPRGAIQEALSVGEITLEEMIYKFREELTKQSGH